MRSLNEKIVEQDEKLPVQLSVAQNVLHKSSFMLAKALLCRTWRPCLLGMFLPSWQLGPLHKRSDNSLLAAVWPSRRLGLLGTVPLGTCPNRQLQQWVCLTGYVPILWPATQNRCATAPQMVLSHTHIKMCVTLLCVCICHQLFLTVALDIS